MSIKLNLTNNESTIICVYCEKQDSRSTKRNQKLKLIKRQHT